MRIRSKGDPAAAALLVLAMGLWTAVSTTVWTRLREGVAALRGEPEAGYSTETVVVTALLVVLAILVIGIIATAVVAKANSITL